MAPVRALFFATSGKPDLALSEMANGELQDDLAYWGAYTQAVAHTRAGRLEEARAYLARADSLIAEYHTPSDRIAFGGAAPFISGWIEGDAQGGSEEIEALLSALPLDEMDPVDRSRGAVALLFALMGASDQARASLDQYYEEVPPDGDPPGRANAAVAEALIRVQGGTPVDGSGLRAAVGSIHCARCRHLFLGHGYEVEGNVPEAINAYEAFVGDGYFDAVLFVLHLPEPVVHERLGQLYETDGDPAKAVEHYRAFVSMWEDADPGLQHRVREARDRVASLGGGI
jgi:tetratricopeptide (TPR) repeat protein